MKAKILVDFQVCISAPLTIFTFNETITSIAQYKLFLREFDLTKASLCFSVQPDKIRKSEIFATFEKIHCWFRNSLNPWKPKIR